MRKIVSLLVALVVMLSMAACAGQPVADTEPTQAATEQAETTLPTEETTQPAHTYDNDCDEDCNDCGQIRTIGDHTYSNACDGECDSCGEYREVSDHQYDDDCDTRCNNCNEKRTSAHGGNVDQVGLCINCGDYVGETCDMNSWTTAEFANAETKYFRFAAGQNTQQRICFEGDATFDYVAYIAADGAYEQVQLTDEPAALVSADYIYLVVTPKDGMNSVVFQMEETQ